MPYRFVVKQRLPNGTVWTSPEVFEGEIRHVRQNVIAGFLNGQARWAETAPGTDNPGFLLYGLNRFGKESNGDPDFSE